MFGVSEIDHLLYGAASLDDAVREMNRVLGAQAMPGGAHPGLGTHNALVGLGATYLELIAPDPAQGSPAGLGAELAQLAAPRLHGFAVRSADLDGIARRLEAVGSGARVIGMSRGHPDGRTLHWQVALPTDHAFGRFLPFAIDWGKTPNPASELPVAGALDALVVEHPDAPGLQRLLEALELPLRVTEAPAPTLRARIATPRGVVDLA